MYDDFIKEEKKHSIKFLKLNQIDSERFDENEYLNLKIILDNVDVVHKIFSNIDDLLRVEKLENMSRYLVFGDFVFSMMSSNLDDPLSLTLKTSRNEYIYRIQERANINTCFGCNVERYVNMHKKLLIGLRKDKIIDYTIIRTKDNVWKTLIFLRLVIDGNTEINLRTSNFPFIIDINKKYSISSFRNIVLLKRKKREMVDFEVCNKSIIRSNNIMLYLNSDVYNLNKDILLERENELLTVCKCKDIKEYINKLNNLINDSSYSRDIDKIYRNDFIEIDMKNEYKEILKNFQKIIPFLILKNNVLDRKYYLPSFMDNRGRQYIDTWLSPTFYKIFRYLYEFVERKKIVNLKESTYYKRIMEYSYLINNDNLNDEKKYLLLVLYIEIGKHFVKAKNDCFVNTEQMIESGIVNYKSENKTDFEEMIYINKMRNGITEILSGREINTNVLIFKDATASGIQNYGRILGYRKDRLEYLNINGRNWCDTYKHLVDKFIVDEKYKERKYWKSTIMTIPYNAVWFSCFIKFTEKLEENGIEYKKMSDIEKSKIIEMHKNFYNEIKNNLKSEFFESNNPKFIEFKYNEWIIIEKKESKVTYRKMRDKYTDLIYDIKEDKKATIRAIEANNMHYLDALLIKLLLESFDLIPIHDCLGVRLSELHLVMDLINKYYSELVGMETYNIHIIK